MLITKHNCTICENRNTELLLQDIFQRYPNIMFYSIGEEITEKEALVLYLVIQHNENKSMEPTEDVIYTPLITLK